MSQRFWSLLYSTWISLPKIMVQKQLKTKGRTVYLGSTRPPNHNSGKWRFIEIPKPQTIILVVTITSWVGGGNPKYISSEWLKELQTCFGFSYHDDWSTNTPLNVTPPPSEMRPYHQGLFKHWFPLIRPKMKPFFLRGCTLGGGLLDLPWSCHLPE